MSKVKDKLRLIIIPILISFCWLSLQLNNYAYAF